MPLSKTSKDEIIKRAFKVFWEKGYFHTSVADLSNACGIEKPHFYYYFESKKDIMISVLNFMHQWIKENLFILAYNKQLPAKKRMQAMLDVLKKLHKNASGGCLFENTALEMANNDDEFLPLLKNYFRDWYSALFHIYYEILDEKQAKQKATSFLNELNGAILMMKLYKDITYLNNFITIKLNDF